MGLPSGWQTPKVSWSYQDFLDPTSLNRIEGNIQAIEQGLRSINQNASTTSANVSLSSFVDYVATQLRRITGEDYWYQSPATNLKALNQLAQIDNLEFVKQFLYHAICEYTKYKQLDIMTLSGSGIFSDVVQVNGLVVFVPNSSTTVKIWNPATNDIFTLSISGGTDYWRGGAACNGKVYCAPFNASSVLVIDVKTLTTSTLSIPDVGATMGRFWGAVARNNKIYFIPHNATKVLVYDTVLQSFYTIGNLSGSSKWAGGALAGGYIFAAPYDSTIVLRVDSSDNITTFGNLSGSAKWVGIASDFYGSNLVCAPHNSSSVLILVPSSTSTYLRSLGITLSQNAFWGVTALPNGSFLLIPHSHTDAITFKINVLQIENVETISVSSSTQKYAGGSVWLNGRVVLAPFNETKIGVIYQIEDYNPPDTHI